MVSHDEDNIIILNNGGYDLDNSTNNYLCHGNVQDYDRIIDDLFDRFLVELPSDTCGDDFDL